MVLLLTFGCALLPGLTAFWLWTGPRVESAPQSSPPELSLQEAAVLRDGAGGATRWAYAALLVKLARDGHCTILRTRKRRWFRTGPVLTLDVHADPTALSSFEQTALRQLGRHDTLGGFGFAGSTFRRRTLRDVRADLIDRGWLADRHRRSNVCVTLGLLLLGSGAFGPAVGFSVLGSAAAAGFGAGSLIAACARYPMTEAGAQRRAAHRHFAETQRTYIQELFLDRGEKMADRLTDALPALILERIATPRWLNDVADRLAEMEGRSDAAAWIQDEVEGAESAADACRTLAHVLRTLTVRTPLW